MSRFTNLTLVLSLAACEQAAPAQNPPVFPEAKIAPAPKPAPEAPVAVEAAPPAVAPVKPQPAAIKPAEKIRVGKPGCRPGSRMACQWREGEDERLVPRVTQKPAPVQP